MTGLHPIPGSSEPADLITEDQLVDELAAVGVASGALLLVHTSLSAIGWVSGGALAVVRALERLVGAEGTLVMPTFTTYLAHPSTWHKRPIPPAWWNIVASTMPPFDPLRSAATPGMGLVAECFRTGPGVRRSPHPLTSFSAAGPLSDVVTATHAPGFRFGMGGPLGRLYDLDAQILQIGTGWSTCTALHLAETLADYPGRRIHDVKVPQPHGAGMVWRQVSEFVYFEGDYPAVGAAIGPALAGMRTVSVGRTTARLTPMRPLVDLARDWLASNRDLRGHTAPDWYLNVRAAPNHISPAQGEPDPLPEPSQHD